jgi:enolase
MPKIKEISCHKIINSRGDWTIETKVVLDDGATGVQAIPDGASKGQNEAIYIPVEKAVDIVSTVINEALRGEDAKDQSALDKVLISMDGTPNKRNLGGNSILSVSLAIASAMAKSLQLELYEYLSVLYKGEKIKKNELKFPTPVFNILNGGKHAENNLSFQEFMVIPAREISFDRALEIGVNIYHLLEKNLSRKGIGTEVGDEGGFAPRGFTTEKALASIRESALERYEVGKDVFLGIDVAAGSFFNMDRYEIKEEGKKLSREELLSYYEDLINKYELIYVEDSFYEGDTLGWKSFYEKFKDKLMIVADDLVVTNSKFLQTAVEEGLANAVIVKPNQVGTLTETLDFIKMAKENKMSVVVSHRSGDNAEDTFIADLALAVSAEFIKSGAPVRGERVSKYNRLLDVFLGK